MKEEIISHIGTVYHGKKQKKIEKKVTKEYRKAAASFLFLRLFSPAIVNPYEYGIYKEKPDKDLQRFLVLISKVLQNLSNGVFFREEYMENMNNFITKNLPSIHQYFENVPVRSSPLSIYFFFFFVLFLIFFFSFSFSLLFFSFSFSFLVFSFLFVSLLFFRSQFGILSVLLTFFYLNRNMKEVAALRYLAGRAKSRRKGLLRSSISKNQQQGAPPPAAANRMIPQIIHWRKISVSPRRYWPNSLGGSRNSSGPIRNSRGMCEPRFFRISASMRLVQNAKWMNIWPIKE